MARESAPPGCLPANAADALDAAWGRLRLGDPLAHDVLRHHDVKIPWPRAMASTEAEKSGVYRLPRFLPILETGEAWVGIPPQAAPVHGWPILVADGLDQMDAQRICASGVVVIAHLTARVGSGDRAAAEDLAWLAWCMEWIPIDMRRAFYGASHHDFPALQAHRECAAAVWLGIATVGTSAASPAHALADVDAMIAWVHAESRLAWSPAPLLLPLTGRPLHAIISEQTGLENLDDPVVALLHQERWRDAKQALRERLGPTADPIDRLRAAIAAMPELKLPLAMDGPSGKPATRTALGEAMRHLQAAIDAANALSDVDRRRRRGLIAEIYGNAARVHCVRFHAELPKPGNAWVNPYQQAVTALRNAIAVDPTWPNAQALSAILRRDFPADRVQH